MDVNITLGDDSNQKHGAIRHLSESSGGGTSDQALAEETATAMASASDAASTPGNTMGTRARMADEDVSSDNTGVSLASSTPLQAKEILSEEDSVKTASSDSDLETSRRTFLQHQVAPGAADGVTERVDTIRSALPAVHPTESDLDDPGGDSTSDNSRGRAAATHSEKESIPGTERGIPIESQEGSECRTNEEAGVDVDWPSCSTSKHVASNGPSAQGTPQEVAESEDTIHGKPPLVSIEDDAAATEISSVPQTPSIVDPSRSLGYSAGAGKGMEVENAGGGHVEQPFSGALQAQAMAEAARAQAALHATATAAAGIVGGAGGAVNAAAAAAVSAAGAAAAAAAAAAGEAFSIADGDGAPEALTIMSRDEVSSWIQRDAPHWILIRYQLYVLGFLLLMILILWRRYGSMISVLYEDLDGPISLDRPRLSERLQPIEEHPPTTRPRTQGGSPGRGGQGRPSAGRRSPRSRS